MTRIVLIILIKITFHWACKAIQLVSQVPLLVWLKFRGTMVHQVKIRQVYKMGPHFYSKILLFAFDTLLLHIKYKEHDFQRRNSLVREIEWYTLYTLRNLHTKQILIKEQKILFPDALETISYTKNLIQSVHETCHSWWFCIKGYPNCSEYQCQMVSYRSGSVNLNMVNLKFHLILSFFEIFATSLSFHV